MAQKKTIRPYGTWDSPVSPASLAQGMNFSDVAWDESGALVWRETRSSRGVLVVQPADGQAARDLNSDYSTRAGVGYGGGDFTVGSGMVYFVEASSGRLFCQPLLGGSADPITPAFGRLGAPTLSPDGRWLILVHTYEENDALAIVDMDGKYWPSRLVSGDDFYMQPCWHPDGKHIAWIAWNHPNMPWDGTFLRLGSLDLSENSLPALRETSTLAGDDQTPIFQPTFSPDGRRLAYVSEQGGWWQIYLYDLEKGVHTQVTHTPAEHGEPAWIQGMRTYTFSPDGRFIFFIRNLEASTSLWRLELDTGEEHPVTLPGYTTLDQPAISRDGKHIALLASGGSIPGRILTYSVEGGTRIIRRATAEELPATAYSEPRHIQWEGMDGGRAYGLYYPPRNEDFVGTGLPPLTVLVHGGPTDQSTVAFSPKAQFFTSRGYAVLEVNYRGSTGYGREYRNMLRGNWGIFDVQDSVSGARYLIEQKLADGSKVVIMGGSAGGYTVLKALEDYPGFFKAGVCQYGVSNMFTLASDTHKFEAHYLDSMLGPLPQAADIYRSRSPIFFADKIQDPLILFQGEEDVAVPRSQSDEMVASLKQRGIPYEYHLYAGEGHGFRKSETIEHMYSAIEKFLKHWVIFA